MRKNQLITYFSIAPKLVSYGNQFLSFWYCLGDAFHNKKKSFELAWRFHAKKWREKKKKNLGGDLFVIVLDIVEGKKARGH